MTIIQQAKALAQAVKDAPESERLRRAKQGIEGDAQAKAMIDDFHAKEFYLQQMQMTGQSIPEDKMAEMQKLAEVLMLSPKLAEYLQAERSVHMLFADVMKIVGEGFDVLNEMMRERLGL
jgi:cell fate (sporulation/competence/biofilm development) regulator YlbF (YheA/YmcA/DUF963 family)